MDGKYKLLYGFKNSDIGAVILLGAGLLAISFFGLSLSPFGISQTNLNKLQRIQNSLARVITNTSKYQHITPTLKKLHWLPIKQRIDYKTCLLTYKTLTNQQPTYLYNSLSFPSHSVSTRSSDSLVLSIPYVRSSLGKRAFSVIGPRLWNSLPPDTRNSSSLPIFRSRLKTHLFKIAFPP